MKLLTVSEMLEIERASDASGHSYAAMMDCAGRSLAEIMHQAFESTGQKSVLALVGKGNNGGDALVALDYLCQWGWRAAFILVDRDADDLVQRALQAGAAGLSWPQAGREALDALMADHACLLDGLLGTGIRLPLRPPVDDFLTIVGDLLPESMVIVAVDTPSGIDCRTGEAAPQTLPADMTVTMAAAKTGLFAYPAAGYLGDLRCGSIGLADNLPEWAAIRRGVVDETSVTSLLPDRPADGHKGTFGTAVICAGSRNYPGAALLAGKAAFRVGAGLITTACPEPIYRIIAGHFPESTWLPLEGAEGVLGDPAARELLSSLDRVSGLLIGPGFGLAPATAEFVRILMGSQEVLPPLVVDADGLKHLAGIANWSARLPKNSILTPHPGEMSVLTGLSTGDVQQNRLGVAEEYAAKWGHVVVLKGAFTLVCAPDGRTMLVPLSTPALARAGTGDVLAGMITGLRAQGLDAFDASVAGAWLHAQAGLAALEKYGSPASVIAGDLLDVLPGVMTRHQ